MSIALNNGCLISPIDPPPSVTSYNTPPIIIADSVEPRISPEGVIRLCHQQSSNILDTTFKIGRALEFDNGDTLYSRWFVDYVDDGSRDRLYPNTHEPSGETERRIDATAVFHISDFANQTPLLFHHIEFWLSDRRPIDDIDEYPPYRVFEDGASPTVFHWAAQYTGECP